MEILISVILTVVITAPSVYFFTKKITLETLKLECEKNFQISKNNLQESVIKNHKSEDGYKAILSNEYIRGKIDGSKEELEKFSISYQPFIERINGMIWDDAAIGYEMQIFYAGFPIGEPTRKITNHEKKFKEELVDKILNSEVAELLNSLVQLAASKGISAKAILSPKRTKATLNKSTNSIGQAL